MGKHYAINLARQVGSGGHAVADVIARRLDINMYDKQILAEAAKDSGIDTKYFAQVEDSPIKRNILSNFILGFSSSIPSSNFIDSDTLFKFQSDSIRTIHNREDCVFVGRCADYILRESDMCANFFISANMEDRIRWMMLDCNCDEKKAIEMINDNDRHRAAYYNYYTVQKWGYAGIYDLCLNTSVIGIEHCADLIIETTFHKLNIQNQ